MRKNYWLLRALKKWHYDLLGTYFTVKTDHHTLESLPTQKELSRRQARWTEFFSQYDYKIEYVPGPDNSVADALSRIADGEPATPLMCAAALACKPKHSIPTCTSVLDLSAMDIFIPPVQAYSAATLSITADRKLLSTIHRGYEDNFFCQSIINNLGSTPGAERIRDLIYMSGRLLIPCSGTARETLLRLAHDEA